ncbi:MAG: class I SAM-dependent methyltransferase [Acidobacteriota bacterium]
MTYPEQLRLAGLLTEPAVRHAIDDMQLPRGSTGIDAGCGIGQHALWLAEAIGSGGKVTGVDISTENLTAAAATAEERGFTGRVKFRQGDLLHLPFEDSSFDWAWCADTLWPVAGMDPVAGVRELRRVVRPGGKIGVLFWSGQTVLPGYPLLEARLYLAHAAANPYLKDVPPELHFVRANSWLRSAGLTEIRVRTYAAETQAPLSADRRDALAYWFSMFWGDLEAHVSEEVWAQFRRLCDPGSTECILRDPDYHSLITYTLFRATVPV